MRHYIVIESDTSSVKKIKTIADGFDDMFFSGSTDNEKDALTLIFQNNPDIVFLDIDNTIDGLPEFLLDVNQHSNNQPAFIGLSFSEKNAFRAYRYDFFDYLLKPIVELNLCRSILKYKKKHPSKAYEMICLKSNKDYQYLNTDDILFLKADNNTTDFQMNDGSVIGAYKTLKTFEDTLPSNFLRIHKSYIINSKFISRIHYGKGVCIIKKPPFHIPFTKTFIDNIDLINTRLSNKAFMTLN